LWHKGIPDRESLRCLKNIEINIAQFKNWRKVEVVGSNLAPASKEIKGQVY